MRKQVLLARAPRARCSRPSTRRRSPRPRSRCSSSCWPRPASTPCPPTCTRSTPPAGSCRRTCASWSCATARPTSTRPRCASRRTGGSATSSGGRWPTCTVPSPTTATSWPPRSTRSCSACDPTARCGAATGASTTTPRTSCRIPRRPRAVTPPDGLYLRSERQTLRRLTTADVVLFTIRTQQVPLAVLAERPDIAHRFADAIAQLVTRAGGLQGRPRRPGRPAVAGEPVTGRAP